MKRGQFLLGITLAMLTGIAGCGGSGPSSSASGPSLQSGAPITPRQRIAAINAVNAEMVRLMRANHPRPCQALATFIQRRTEFSAALGYADRVSATFRDGRKLHITANFRDLEERAPTLDTRDTLAPTELPNGKATWLSAQSGEEFDAHPAVMGKLRTMLAQGGYVPAGTYPISVESLKSIGTPAVLYLHTHGGAFGNTNEWFMATDSMVTEAFESRYNADLAAGRIVYTLGFFRRNLWNTVGSRGRYAIGSKFVTAYWRLAPNALVVLNACNSGGASAAPFRSALLAKGAGAVVGWNGNVTTGGYPILVRLFDRLLGANLDAPPSPKNRPFNIEAVIAHMRSKGLISDPNNPSTSLVVTYGSRNFANLRPWIKYLETLPNNKVDLIGQFGSVPGKVTVGGRELPATWGAEKISLTVPENVVGDVVVNVNDHKSNPRQLIQWTGLIKTQIRIFNGDIPQDAFDQKVDYRLTLRADGHLVRQAVDGVGANATHVKAKFSATNASVAGYAVTGFVKVDNQIVRTWFGSGSFRHITASPTGNLPPGTFAAIGLVAPKERRLQLLFFPCLDRVSTFRLGTTTYTTHLSGLNYNTFDSKPGDPDGIALFLTMGANFDIAARTWTWNSPGTAHKAQWAPMPANPKKNPNQVLDELP
jgi:hypothetical protein